MSDDDEKRRVHVRMVAIAAIVSFLTFVSCAAFFARLWDFDQTGKGASILMAVIFSGALGASFGFLRRLALLDHHNLSPAFMAAIKSTEGWKGSSVLLLFCIAPIMIGMISSTVLYVIFAGQMLEGGLFPKFACGVAESNACDNFHGFIADWRPAKAHDFAKAIVWGFIAGVFERFLYDSISKFVEPFPEGKREPSPAGAAASAPLAGGPAPVPPASATSPLPPTSAAAPATAPGAAALVPLAATALVPPAGAAALANSAQDPGANSGGSNSEDTV